MLQAHGWGVAAVMSALEQRANTYILHLPSRKACLLVTEGIEVFLETSEEISHSSAVIDFRMGIV